MELFTRHIEALDIDHVVKQELLQGDMTKKHQFYIHLSTYLAPLYPHICFEKIEKFSFCSYLYFRFFFELETVPESPHQLVSKETCISSKFGKWFAATGMHEKAVREFSVLFPEESSFWHSLEGIKKQYFDAVCQEKQLLLAEGDFHALTFEKLAVSKAVIGQALVAALGHHSGINPHESAVNECLGHIHTAFQYLEQMDTFKKDVAAKRHTYLCQLVDRQLRQQGISPETITVEKRYKYVFISGIAEQIIGEALRHYRLALQVARGLQLHELISFLGKEMETCRHQQDEILKVVTKARLRAEKSFQLQTSASLGCLQAIPEAMELSLMYLSENMDSDFFWQDFFSGAGLCRQWVTAYTGFQLADMDPKMTMLDKVAQVFFKGNAPAIVSNALSHDGDTASFMMGFHKKHQPQTEAEKLNYWLSFTDAEGRWATYRDERLLRSRLKIGDELPLNGWMTPKICVTATAAYMLSLFDELKPGYHNTVNYLLQNRHPEGYWTSYWWTSPVYATSFAIAALAKTPEYRLEGEKSVDWLLAQQHESGCWLNQATDTASAFYTALAVKALMLFDFEKHRKAIVQGISWLLKHQVSDGSWLTGRIFRIPSPEVEDAGTVEKWRSGSLGTNLIVQEHNRVFTTATVANALYTFQRLSTCIND